MVIFSGSEVVIDFGILIGQRAILYIIRKDNPGKCGWYNIGGKHCGLIPVKTAPSQATHTGCGAIRGKIVS